MGNTENGQYELFDDEQIEMVARTSREHNTEADDEQGKKDDFKIEIDDLETLYNIACKIGMYFPLSNEDIIGRSRAYYFKNIGEVENYLNASGLTEETKEVVKRDYLLALCGYYNYQAEPKQIYEAMEKLRPNRAFMIDRYGFYRLLLLQYYKYYRVVYDFTTNIKGADAATKQKYLDTFPVDSHRAAAWAINKGFIKLLDFEGVHAQLVAEFANVTRCFSSLDDYANFYHLCKYAYLSTPDELATIRQPDELATISAVYFGMEKRQEPSDQDKEKFKNDFLDEFCETAEKELSKAAKFYADAMEKKTPDLGKWNSNGVKLSANLTTVQQKPLEVKSKFVTDTVPIRKYVAEFPLVQGYEMFRGLVTENTLQTVIGGLDAIRSWGQYNNVKPVNGIRSYHITMEDFAKICGYVDANQNDKLGLFGALLLLNNLYVYCDRPMRFKPVGKKAKYKIGGWLKIFDLRGYSDDKNDLLIDIIETDLGGELIPITPANFLEMRKSQKGLSEKRFTEQILGKDNKKEDDLVSECFGYDDMIKYALPEDLKDVKTYIRKHKSTDRKKIQAWFDKYKEQGLIVSYTRKQNKAGEWVYKWKRTGTEKKELTEPQNTGAEQPTGETLPEQ